MSSPQNPTLPSTGERVPLEACPLKAGDSASNPAAYPLGGGDLGPGCAHPHS